jgi:ATP adenylyltransferase
VIKTLWAPWRAAYVEGGAEADSCIFCVATGAPERRKKLVLAEARSSIVMLNKYPYNGGHLLVAPKNHERSLASLSTEDYGRVCEAVRRCVAILGAAYRPDGFNVGINLGRAGGAGVEAHLHWHVVPRWEGDTNFMSVIGEVKVMSQDLTSVYDRLAPYFREFSD